jgi:ABC-type Fe3+-hydroxamate transport system substrate-binding protein
MPEFVDQTGRVVAIADYPQRIISLVPSQTELLYDLGLCDRIAGITKFCVHPSHLRSQTNIVGGTKRFNADKIAALSPDLIIANKEENERGQILQLAERFPVWISDICNLDDALKMIREVGIITGSAQKAAELVIAIQNAFDVLNQKVATTTTAVKAAYLIWKNPYMAAASGTFIDDMLHLCRFDNVFAGLKRYPEVNESDLVNADVILLSTEPFPFREKHVKEVQQQFPNSIVSLADGEFFSWYGSRLLKAPEYFVQLRSKLISEMKS